jgi:hypothetical protein
LAFLASAGAFGQNPLAGLGGVSSTYALGNATFGSTQFAVAISVSYNSNLMPSAYVSQAQFTSDFQSFVAAYPNAGDPVEAILLSVANSFANKYAQIGYLGLAATAGSSSSPSAIIEAAAGNLDTSPITGEIARARLEKLLKAALRANAH